jgi:DDE_Tnp_1-associated
MEHDQAYSTGACFAALEDPRVERPWWHSLEAIVAIALCAVICGADGWVEIAECGKAKEAWFATILDLPHDTPSHDTFGRVFAALDPDQFEACFREWVAGVGGTTIAKPRWNPRTQRGRYQAQIHVDSIVALV